MPNGLWRRTNKMRRGSNVPVGSNLMENSGEGQWVVPEVGQGRRSDAELAPRRVSNLVAGW